MVLMVDVMEATKEFLDRHWQIELLDTHEIPDWESYCFKGNIPGGNKQGCYTLVAQGEVIYIGLGASRGRGKYEEHVIAARLMNHIIKWDSTRPAPINIRYFMPRSEWAEVTAIYTIGFPRGYEYLACALEAFLMSELKPSRNVNRPRTSNLYILV